MTALAWWVVAVLYVEATTELLIKGEIFDKPRLWLHALSGFTSALISCGYCLSVWVSASIAWALPLGMTEYQIIEFIIKLLALHRMSNILHEFIARWLGRIPLSIVVFKTETLETQ